MRTLFLIFAVCFLVSGTAIAEKPEWAGKGKPTAEQKAAHKNAMNAKEGIEEIKNDTEDKVKEKKQKKNKTEKTLAEGKSVKGIEKQQEKKSSQVQKELGKGSDKGQEASRSKKKWWKFWE